MGEAFRKNVHYSDDGVSLVEAADYAAMRGLISLDTDDDVAFGTITAKGAVNTYSADTAAKLLGYAHGTGGYPEALRGDKILLSAGTYDIGTTLLNPEPGVTIEGVGTSSTTIAGVIKADLAGSPHPLTLTKLTIDSTGEANSGLYGANELHDGTFILIDVAVTGVGSGEPSNGLTLVANDFPLTALLRNVVVHDVKDDCISIKAPGGATVASKSRVELYDCEAYASGSGATDNCLTPHDGVATYDYDGYYHGSVAGPTVATDAATTPMICNRTTITHEGTSGVAVYATQLIDCDISHTSTVISAVVYEKSLRSRYSLVNLMLRANGEANGNTLIGCGIVLEETGTCYVLNNYVADYSASNVGGIWVNTAFGGTAVISGNVVKNCYRNFYFRAEGSPTITLVGNKSIDPVQYAVMEYGASGSITYTNGGCNILSGNILTYALDAGDIVIGTSVLGEVSQDTSPQLGGDLDANGNTIHFGTTENEATIATGTNPNTCTVNLGAENHWTIPANDANNPITATITVPPGPCAGRILIEQGATPRDITWTSSAGTVAWLGTEPTWTDASEASEIHAVSWTWNGTYVLLSDAGKTSITP